MRSPATFLPAALLTLASTTYAAPTPDNQWFPWATEHYNTQTATLPNSTLPAPTTALQVIALGLGVQNYTCSSPNANATAIGAVANLYNITALIENSGNWKAQAEQSATCLADHFNSAGPAQQIGVHYFNGAGVPNFDLYGVGMYLQATKVAAYPAPSPTAQCSTGRSGAPPVPWLFLRQDGTGKSSKLSGVYRMETVGGSATSCANTQPGQVISVDYAAEYYFYA